MLRISTVLLLFIVFCQLLFIISGLMINRYIWKHKLVPKWRILTGFTYPHVALGAYIKSTKQEYGHVGMWIKTLVSSFILMMLSGLLMAIFN